MKDHIDNNGIWADTVKIMRAKAFNKDLRILDPAIRDNNLYTNMSRFVQKLEHCTGENAEVLRDHLKQTKFKIKGFGIDPNSREAVMVELSSFTRQLIIWVAAHADGIFKLDSVDAFTAYFCVRFPMRTWRARI